MTFDRVHGKEGNGKRKRKAESGNGKQKTEISQLCKVNDHYHSVFFDMNMNMDSRELSCRKPI